jgi:Carboxypeptidase regulatory-like domain
MKNTDRLDNLRIASACPTGWEQMTGDDRVRFCELCNLHVYNIERLTRKEAEALIGETEGRICARLYRRDDGTIITKDCPVGLAAIRRRVSRIAGAIFATIVGLCSVVLGQKPSEKDKGACRRQVTISRSDSQTEAGVISGTILDPNGATIPGAVITVTSNEKNGPTIETKSDADGSFKVATLPAGSYQLKVVVASFKSLVISDIKLAKKEFIRFDATLLFDHVTVTIGILGGPELLNTTTPTNKIIFNEDLIHRLPIH